MSESNHPWKRACPILHNFCNDLVASGIRPSIKKPELSAVRFRAFIEASHPFNMRQANAMIQVLNLTNVVFFQPRLKTLTGINRARGTWIFDGVRLTIYVQPVKRRSNGLPTRPVGSIIHTLLHEIAEIILEISYDITGECYRLPIKKRERWANRFAGMCMMPPEQFAKDATKYGLDLRLISGEYETSLASISRQIRDVSLSDGLYYFCRCDFVENLGEENNGLTKEQGQVLSDLVEQTGGYVVRVRDVVRNKIDAYRSQHGGLPMHNLPSNQVYRVVSPVFRECIEEGRSMLIENITGGASFENNYCDLFGLQNMSLLVVPYGYKRVRGFFLQAVEPSIAHHLHAQAMDLGIEAKNGVSWLFSQLEYKAPPRKVKQIQKTLKLDDLSDIDQFAFPWLLHDEINWKAGTSKQQPINE